MRIAVVEDNEPLARGIAYALQDEGHAVDLHHDGMDGLENVLATMPDAIVLDLNLPGLDGIEVLRQARERGCVAPVMLLTARGDLEDRIAGLDAGADDYLVKPFDMTELTARLRALLRRRGDRPVASIRIGGLVFDTQTRELRAADRMLPVPRRETALFEALALAPGRLVPREHLIEHVYGIGSDVEDGTLDSHISRLRSRVAPYGAVIRVVRGLGYIMEDI